MEVKVNTKKKILRSFLGWLPLAVVAAGFYYVVFVIAVMSLLTKFADIPEEQARQTGWIVGGTLLLIGIYLYLTWLTNSLSSYQLAIKNDNLVVRGKDGWKTLDTRVSIKSIQKIYVGQNAHAVEKLSSGNAFVHDQISSRLTFFLASGKSFNLDFAVKAFDNQSLYDFLVFLKSKGIETNVNA